MTALRDEVVTVTIAGRRHRIRTEHGEEHAEACARHVDEIMQGARTVTDAEWARAAVLAALRITDDLFGSWDRAEGMLKAATERVAEVSARLDELAALHAPQPDSSGSDAGTDPPGTDG